MQPKLSLIIRMGDNALILAQQNLKWCGKGPILEEDIALSNVSLDLLGHARMWLSSFGEIEGKGRDEDTLAFFRDTHEFFNAFLCEEPAHSYDFVLMRQYLFDLWHHQRVSQLLHSSSEDIKIIAEKVKNEVDYHIHRSRNVVQMLADGSEESVTRMQNALDLLWPSFGSLFEDDSRYDPELESCGIANRPSSFRPIIDQILKKDLHDLLTVPTGNYFHKGAINGIHSENLGHILTDMQWLQRSYPGLSW